VIRIFFSSGVEADIYNQAINAYEELATTTLKITYDKGGVIDPFTRAVTTPPTSYTKSTTCIIKESKVLVLGTNTTVINNVPPGYIAFYLRSTDRVDFSALSETELNTLRFTIFYGSTESQVYTIDVSTEELVFMFGNPSYLLYQSVLGKKLT
jgi:hypothetical protein